MISFKKLFKNKNTALLFKLILACVVIYLIYSLFKKCKEGYHSKKELILLHMDGCPHCVELQPQWDAAKLENKTDIVMLDYERKQDKCKKICEKYNINGFPTILLMVNGDKKDVYSGERSKKGIIHYLKSLV